MLKKKKSSSFSEPFALSFLGERVDILLKIFKKVTSESNEETVSTTEPILAWGFILDKDDEYYYLGDSPDQINKCIRITDVAAIEISKSEQDVIFNQLLDQVDSKDGVN